MVKLACGLYNLEDTALKSNKGTLRYGDEKVYR